MEEPKHSQMIEDGFHERGEWVPHQRETWPYEYGELREDTKMCEWLGHRANPEYREYTAPSGTTVRIVMVSRFADIGVTTDLSKGRGYGARIHPEDLTSLRKEL